MQLHDISTAVCRYSTSNVNPAVCRYSNLSARPCFDMHLGIALVGGLTPAHDRPNITDLVEQLPMGTGFIGCGGLCVEIWPLPNSNVSLVCDCDGYP